MSISEWLANNALFLLLAAGTLFSFLWLFRFREKLRMTWWAAALLSVLHTLVGVVSVMAFAVLKTFNLDDWGNMSLFGGVFFMPLLYLAGAKLFHRSPALVCDLFTPCIVGTVMCARVNCIISGCCKGLLLPGNSGLRWPTRELEILFYLILLVILIRRISRGQNHGEIYPIYMIAYGAFRFVIEWFREADSPFGMFHLAHIWALICLGLGLSIYYAQKNRMKSPKYTRR